MEAQSYADDYYLPGSPGDVLRMIRRSPSVSRSELVKATELAAATVSLRVESLMRLGLVKEVDGQAPRGGRRPRPLEIAAQAGFVAAIELGANHARLDVSDLSGRPLSVLDSTDGAVSVPDSNLGVNEVADQLWAAIQKAADRAGLAMPDFLGAAISVPAPVDYPSGRLATPSSMPNWHEFVLPHAFARLTDRPILVENDANLIALDQSQRSGSPAAQDLIAVKLGSRIGSGIVINGLLYRGQNGVAGEIAHFAVPGTSYLSCSCGVDNCLESVASGGALAARLRSEGLQVEGPSDVVTLGDSGNRNAAVAIREAGESIGRVLASVVNLLNPGTVVLAGRMSTSSTLVAAIRGEIYRHSFPAATRTLSVHSLPHDAHPGIVGATMLILNEVLAPARVNLLLDQQGLTHHNDIVTTRHQRREGVDA